jgi:hypothetical protein
MLITIAKKNILNRSEYIIVQLSNYSCNNLVITNTCISFKRTEKKNIYCTLINSFCGLIPQWFLQNI